MRILGIETSCDETGIALVEASGGLKNPRFKVLKNLVASQIKIHSPFGGVVPNLAKREHIKNLPILYRKVFGEERRAKSKSLKSRSPFAVSPLPDIIAVTVGPGLEPALWAGIEFAKSLINADAETQMVADNISANPRGNRRKFAHRSKLIGANHLEGHLYSFLLPQRGKEQIVNSKSLFPAIALIVSGGHTILLKMDSFSKWKKLGETRDDAAGEAFDKVARLLKLPYPGGPEIEKLAVRGDQNAIDFPRPMMRDKSYDFSFSGLKTAVLYHLRGQNQHTSADNAQTNAEKSRRKSALSTRKSADAADIAASFQQAAIDVLVAKTMRASREFDAKSVMLSGGVAANGFLRKRLGQTAKNAGLKFLVPDFKYNLDNAAMIAVAGYMTHMRKKKYPLRARGDLGI